MDDRPTFEETFPRYPFAPLVHAGIAAGRWVLRILHLAEARSAAAQDKTGLYAD